MKTSTIALISAGVATTLGIGYLIYFDSKRRNDPTFRRQLRKERKQAAKASKDAEKKAQQSKLQMIENVIVTCAREVYPETPEEKEKYFMDQVATGEELCKQGPDYYNDAVLPFYKALKVYPAPQELLMIYQKTIPEPVFQAITSILMIEQQAMAGQQTETPEAAAAAATGVDIE